MLSKFDSINSIMNYLREPPSTPAVTSAAVKGRQHADNGLKTVKKQGKGKGLTNGTSTTPSPPQLSPQSQSDSNIEPLPKGRVRYGPITVNPRKLPSKTLFTGRRSKYEVLSTDEEERRRDRRERNRLAATKCREKRETVLSRLEEEHERELKNHRTLLLHIDELEQKKQYLDSVLTNHRNECPLLNPTSSMVFGNTYFLSNITDTPPPLLPSYQQPSLYREDDERSHIVDLAYQLTNSAYESDTSNGFFPPVQEQQAQPIVMTSSSIERLINSLQSPTISMENAGNHSMLFNSAVGGSTCAQQHSHSSDDDSLPPARTNPYVY